MREGAISRLSWTTAGGTRSTSSSATRLLGEGVPAGAGQRVDGRARHTRREVAGLRAGMRRLDAAEGWIVTMDEEEEIDVPEGAVHVVPAWRWLLG